MNPDHTPPSATVVLTGDNPPTPDPGGGPLRSDGGTSALLPSAPRVPGSETVLLPPAGAAPAPLSGLHPWSADQLPEAPAVVLEVTEGPHAGAAFPLAGHARFFAGRQPGLHLSLPDDPYLSRVHCVVEVNPPLARVCDLNSKNGITVNGRRTASADLVGGDTIRVGRTVLRVASAELRVDRTATLDPTPPTSRSGPGAGTLPEIPGYRLGRELGRGGMGVVYAATAAGSGEAVAVKLILPAAAPTPTAVARFRREADVLARLSHPHVVGFRVSGEAGGMLFVVMEFAPGPTADGVVAAAGPVPPARVRGWAAQLLDALAHAHDRGVVHRDVKPSNLIVTRAGGADHLKLADFGLAKAYDATGLSGLTATNANAGTPLYMPPEQATDLRSVGPAADQYAAAATLHLALTGRPVYEPTGTALEQYMRVMCDPPAPLRPGAADLPGGFGPVVRRALARDPRDRFPDVAAMRAALPGG